MGCGCRNPLRQEMIAGIEQRLLSRAMGQQKLVNFEGNMIAADTLPQGCYFIRGVWYSSPDALPEGMRKQLKGFCDKWALEITERTKEAVPVENQDEAVQDTPVVEAAPHKKKKGRR